MRFVQMRCVVHVTTGFTMLAIVLIASAVRAEEPLATLQSETMQALADRDARLAYDLAAKLALEADGASEPSKPTYLLTAAAVMDAVGMKDESRRVMGLRANSLREHVPVEVDTPLIARVLREIQPFSQSAAGFHNNMQFELLSFYQQVLAGSIDPSLPAEERAQQLEQLLGEHEQRLIEAEVPASIAKVLTIGNLLAAAQLNRTADVENWLNRLQPLLESAEVASKWKALLWNKLTELSIVKRRYAEALDNGQQFAYSAVQSGDFDAQVTCVEQLAVVYLHMGDYAAARFLLSQTENIQRGNPNIEQANRWRINMSKALEGDREYLLSRQLLSEARELSRDVVSYDAAMLLNNLAVNHYLTGNLAEAQKLLSECRTVLDRVNANALQLAEASITAGWFALASEQLETARGEFQNAQQLLLSFPAAGRTHPRYAEALACEARAAAAMHDHPAAVKLIAEAESLAFASMAKDLAATGATRDRLAILQAARVHPESVSWPGVFDTYLELADAIGLPLTSQFDAVLKWKGVLNRLDQRRHDLSETDEISRLNEQLRDLYFRPVSRLKRRAHMQEMEVVENQLRAAERNLAASLSDQQLSESPTVAAVAAAVGQQSVFVDILQVRKYQPPQAEGIVGAVGEYLAFVVSPSGSIHRVTLGDADAIDAAIDFWRKQIIEEKAEQRQASQRVAEFLQRPLLSYLQSAERLVIREDGMCHLVPWSALPGRQENSFWIEDLSLCSVQDVLSDAEALSPSDPGRDAQALLLVGGVDYGPLSDTWLALPGTLSEANRVEKVFEKQPEPGEIHLLSGRQASEAAVLSELKIATFAHLATHGFYLKQDSNNSFGLTTATTLLNSGLILAAPADQEQGNQQLTAAEISESELSNLRLIVLSACETGMGKIKAGQGVDGLASSFHAAGVGCVVSSRWKVPDTETAELMFSFYVALWLEGKPPAEALRQAQLHMIRAPELTAAARSPVSWAAFNASFATLTDRAGSR